MELTLEIGCDARAQAELETQLECPEIVKEIEASIEHKLHRACSYWQENNFYTVTIRKEGD